MTNPAAPRPLVPTSDGPSAPKQAQAAEHAWS